MVRVSSQNPERPGSLLQNRVLGAPPGPDPPELSAARMQSELTLTPLPGRGLLLNLVTQGLLRFLK